MTAPEADTNARLRRELAKFQLFKKDECDYCENGLQLKPGDLCEHCPRTGGPAAVDLPTVDELLHQPPDWTAPVAEPSQDLKNRNPHLWGDTPIPQPGTFLGPTGKVEPLPEPIEKLAPLQDEEQKYARPSPATRTGEIASKAWLHVGDVMPLCGYPHDWSRWIDAGDRAQFRRCRRCNIVRSRVVVPAVLG